MPVGLYMDHHVPRPITSGLRRRGVDVLTAAEDGADRLSDPDLLDRAAALERVLFSQDRDLLREATRRQIEGLTFAGVIYGHQRRVTVGDCVRDLEIIAKISDFAEMRNRVLYLPL
jgi:hypothetical protein